MRFYEAPKSVPLHSGSELGFMRHSKSVSLHFLSDYDFMRHSNLYRSLATTSWLPDPGFQILATTFCFQSLINPLFGVSRWSHSIFNTIFKKSQKQVFHNTFFPRKETLSAIHRFLLQEDSMAPVGQLRLPTWGVFRQISSR